MRDFDTELEDSGGHQYAYDFDLDVMHRFKIEAFRPYLRPGRLLELGSHEGDFTERLLPLVPEITCVDASADALAVARQRLGDRVAFVHATIEEAVGIGRYENVVVTHVLEHLDDPVAALRRINDEWLTPDGRLFLVCPNADAPSRQIAVHMGLIPHNEAVTAAEAAHGHRRTYALDTLERDALAANLRVVVRSGIFFKALANFQWDQVLKTKIVSEAYLDGCYRLGQRYPQLCASIFLLCERGEPA